MQQKDLFENSRFIIEQAQKVAYQSVNVILVKRNWLLGKLILENILCNEDRADYGNQVIKGLADKLTSVFGEGFDKTNIHKFVAFARTYPTLFKIVDAARLQSDQIVDAVGLQLTEIICPANSDQNDLYSKLIPEVPVLLPWTHYRILIQVDNELARKWYEQEAVRETWSSRMLQRNVSSQYYFRLLQTPQQDAVRKEMHTQTASMQDKLEYMKNPVVAEFLGFHHNTDYTESDLEKSILNHLPQFLLEMGKGFAFVDRQKHICTEKRDYFIDLVFYNYLLRCFVLIDLKTTTVDYQDAGQMDMYVKMYDERYLPEGHNPTIGILLCADTDEDVARYSTLHDNDQLYMAKYLTYMPTQEELRREIEHQKQVFRLKNG